MQKIGGLGMAAAIICALAGFEHLPTVTAAGGPAEGSGPYRVLAPIESGSLLLFPVVRTDGKAAGETPFLTLDEGFKSGEVEVTEAGRAQGLVRPRRGGQVSQPRGDEVNTLVLVNHSKRPLLLLAGEIVTGGKQDRIIAKDRIVPAGADPIDLSVFCIEPGRWTGATASFGAAGNGAAKSFMVQPQVREQAMAAQDQQKVWDSVHGAIAGMAVAAAAPPPTARPGTASETVTVTASAPTLETESAEVVGRELGTTSYAKAMQNKAVSAKVDEAAAPAIEGREQVMAKLREEHAVGVVVSVNGEIIWADLFANTDLLARYWTKLVRSYAAESLAGGEDHATPSIEDAQHFLNAPTGGTETSEGDVGIYRYRDLKSDRTETFVLESLLPGTGYDVHISKMKLRGGEQRVARPRPDGLPSWSEPQIYR
jgi:hypothetical protein